MQDVLILGAGRVGSEIARALTMDNLNVTVVDVSASRLLELQSHFDLRTVRGNAADPKVLQQANAEDASIVVAVTAIDEVNLVACKVCEHVSENIQKIARIRSSQYSEEIICKGFGINTFFCPEELVADNFSSAISHPGCLSVHHFADKQLALAGIRVSPKTDIAGAAIKQLREQIQEIDYRIVAVYRDEGYVSPTADCRLFVGDEIYLLAAADKLQELAPFFAGPQQKNQRIFIAGGGNIGRRVAANFEEKHDVKVLEMDRDRCRALSGELSRSLILKGRASDEKILEQEGIAETDIFCALTSDDEENILSAMLAKRQGAKRTAVLINRASYLNILERQLDIILSPSQITIGSVLAALRPGGFNVVHSLRHGSAEAVEITARGNVTTSKLAGREIRQIEWPEGIIPGAILRGEKGSEKILIAHDETTVAEDDHIICFVADRSALRAMEKLIQVELGYIGQ